MRSAMARQNSRSDKAAIRKPVRRVTRIAELAGRNVGERGECADFPAVCELSVDGDRATPIPGEIAPGVDLAVKTVAKIVIRGHVAVELGDRTPGRYAGAKAELLIEVARMRIVDLGAKRQAAVHGLPKDFAGNAGIHAFKIACGDAAVEIRPEPPVFRHREILQERLIRSVVEGDVRADPR